MKIVRMGGSVRQQSEEFQRMCRGTVRISAAEIVRTVLNLVDDRVTEDLIGRTLKGHRDVSGKD